MKKYLMGILGILVMIFAGYYAFFYLGVYVDLHPDASVEASFRTENQTIQIKNADGTFSDFVIRGVDVSSSMPGNYATSFAPEEEDYLRWFDWIGEMGANTVRAYTIMDDDFYNAFYTYNTTNEKPLYLLQGITVSDEANMNANDAYSEDFFESLMADGRTAVDIIHGRKAIANAKTHGSGTYFKDISPWVIGILVGQQWDAGTVAYTDHKRADDTLWEGTYFTATEDASAFEKIMGQVMDDIVSYESDKYKEQRLISFVNDPQNDPFHYEENYATQLKKFSCLDAEHLIPTDRLVSGYFASYCIYDFHDDFSLHLSGQEKQAFRTKLVGLDKTGIYDGYLAFLADYHTMPVMIAGYGFSTARAPIAEGVQPLTEEEQGEALMQLYHQAMDCGWSGVFLSTWQDVWERRSWNTAFSTLLTENYLWHDLQTDGQNYGIMAFEPGDGEKVCYVDGDDSEWNDEDIVQMRDDISLSIRQDEEGIYLLIQGNDLKNRKLFIPIDTTEQSGSVKCTNPVRLQFERAADFLLCLDGEEHTRLLVQERYDAMRENFLFEITGEDPFINYPQKDSNRFVPIGIAVSKKMSVDETLHTVTDTAVQNTLAAWDTGHLVHGDGNPNHANYNSFADFCFGNGCVEIRIPWNLLNVADPTRMQIAGDYYENYGMEPYSVRNFWMGIGESQENIAMCKVNMPGLYFQPKWHERLKKSYDVIKREWKGDTDDFD